MAEERIIKSWKDLIGYLTMKPNASYFNRAVDALVDGENEINIKASDVDRIHADLERWVSEEQLSDAAIMGKLKKAITGSSTLEAIPTAEAVKEAAKNGVEEGKATAGAKTLEKEIEETRTLKDNLEKRNPHFGGNPIKNIKDSTFGENCFRLGTVGLGAILVAKACTYDRHQDQEGNTPHPMTKWIDTAAGSALMIIGLFIRPKNHGPYSELMSKLKGASEGVAAAIFR